MNNFPTNPELWPTLARAFLPPLTQRTQDAFRDGLADDLRDLGVDGGPDAGRAIDAFKAAAAGFRGPDDLLVHYSSLFLTPPVSARLNVAACLEGSVNGSAMDGIEALMGKYGIGRSEAFHDTPDHLSSLLEFMAVLDTDADTEDDQRKLAGGLLAPAVRRIRADVARVAPGSPYLHLLDILSFALASGPARQDEKPRTQRKVYNHDPSRGVWAACGKCGQPFAREKELAIIARAMREHGLETAHLALCPACRDPVGVFRAH